MSRFKSRGRRRPRGTAGAVGVVEAAGRKQQDEQEQAEQHGNLAIRLRLARKT